MGKKIAVISLNFRAAHISHLVANYKQLFELGYEPICLVNPKATGFLHEGVCHTVNEEDIMNCDVAIFWFPSTGNLRLMWKLKKRKVKIIYVFHEPIEKFSTYRNSGNSYWWIAKFFAKYYVGLSFLALANKIILPSNKAVRLYENGLSKHFNCNYDYLPLLYGDETDMVAEGTQRKYFSYIGTISMDHAFVNFVDFIYYLYLKKVLPQVKFLIATWSDIPKDARIKEMIDAGRLDCISGKPLTDKKIDTLYASTYVVWNAYHRSTQSGVLAKSFMFGIPALVMKHNLSEFVEDGREVVAVTSNTDISELSACLKRLLDNWTYHSENARKNFERNYFYRVHNTKMQEIIENL